MKAWMIFLSIVGVVMLFIHPMLTLLTAILVAIIWHGHHTVINETDAIHRDRLGCRKVGI